MNERLCSRQAVADDLGWIEAMVGRHRHELGFVRRVALANGIARGEVLVIYREAFIHYHRRRDGWTTVYEVCSEAYSQHRISGCGRALLEAVSRPLRLRCPAGSQANGFYRHLGLRLIRTEPGVLRGINVWEWPAP